MGERWLPVVGFEGRYEVSDLGRVKSLAHEYILSSFLPNIQGTPVCVRKREKLLALSLGSNGYLTVRLKCKTFTVHSLVLTAFVGRRPARLQACHGDGDKINNALYKSSMGYLRRQQRRTIPAWHEAPEASCKRHLSTKDG